MTPTGRPLGLDVTSHHANPGLAPDADGLFHSVGSVETPPFNHAGGLPQGERRLTALVRVVKAVELRDDLRQLDQLFGIAEATGSIFGSSAHAPGTLLHALTDQFLHAGDFVRCGCSLVVLAHHLTAHRRVPYHRHHVESGAGIEVGLHLVRDRPDDVAAVGADDDRRDPLDDEVRRFACLRLVGGERPIRMRVHVDEAGHHELARCVDHAPGGSIAQLAHGDDRVALNSDVRAVVRTAGPIQDPPVTDQQIELLAARARSSRGQEGDDDKGIEKSGPSQRMHDVPLQGHSSVLKKTHRSTGATDSATRSFRIRFGSFSAPPAFVVGLVVVRRRLRRAAEALAKAAASLL